MSTTCMASRRSIGQPPMKSLADENMSLPRLSMCSVKHERMYLSWMVLWFEGYMQICADLLSSGQSWEVLHRSQQICPDVRRRSARL